MERYRQSAGDPIADAAQSAARILNGTVSFIRPLGMSKK
jgi:hypothetical protein